MTPAMLVAGVMLVALVIYTLTGGADFGGGVWDLLARGPRAADQRRLVARAIAPIWEANHVWLIVVVVLFFAAFPKAFAAVSTALHIPLLVMLIGIVLRGSAFTFRAYGKPAADEERRWGQVFAASSALTPFALGVVLGGVTSGRIRVDPGTGRVLTDFVEGWWAPFPVATGFFVLALFAYLAAVYLVVEATDDALQEDFRRRALGAAVAVGVAALAAFLTAGEGAPRIQRGLSAEWWSLPLQLACGAFAIGAIAALWTRRYRLARALAVAQSTLIVVGWGVAQHPYVLPFDLTIEGSAAPDAVLRPILIALAVGSVVLVPSFWYLYAVFKGRDRSESSS